MDAEIKAKWVKALRSGEYEQGAGKLRRADDKFCCLGVLSDLVDDKQWKLSPNTRSFVYGEYESLCWPSQPVMDHSGLPVIEMNKLAEKNDNGATFAEIADYIEEHL